MLSNESKMNSIRFFAPKPPKMQNGHLLSKIALHLKKVFYKVSLCENCQRQSVRHSLSWWALCVCVDVYKVYQRAASRYQGRSQENLPEHHPGSPRYQQLACVETDVVLRLLPAHCRSGIAHCRCIVSLIYALMMMMMMMMMMSNNSQTVILSLFHVRSKLLSFYKSIPL